MSHRFFNLCELHSQGNVSHNERRLIWEAKYRLAKSVFFSENERVAKDPSEGFFGRYAKFGSFRRFVAGTVGGSAYVGERCVNTTHDIIRFEREFKPNMHDPIFDEWDCHPDVVAINRYFEEFRNTSYKFGLWVKADNMVDNPEYKWGSQIKDLWNSLGYSRDEKGVGLNELMPITLTHGHMSVTISNIRETQVACRWWVTIDGEEFDLQDGELLSCLIREWAGRTLAEREEDVWL